MSNLFSNFKSIMYKHYGENPGKMLIHTGVLGWILSSLAQVSAVLFNDKISVKEKSFLVPQEIADAGFNIASFYLITSSFKKVASKLVSTGKLTTKPIKDFLTKNGYNNPEHIGKLDFNIEKLSNFKDIKGEYKPFKNGIDVLASVTGSIISCNIVTPILRNNYASKKQKKIMARLNANQAQPTAPKRVSMDDYQKMASMKFSGGSLKV